MYLTPFCSYRRKNEPAAWPFGSRHSGEFYSRQGCARDIAAHRTQWDVGSLTSWVASLQSQQLPVQVNQVRASRTGCHSRGQPDDM